MAGRSLSRGRTLDRIDLAVQVAGTIRTVTHDGREFRVIPATLVQPQILHNNLGRTFLAPESITDAWAQQSNDAPVVLDHPTSRGFPVSAKSPEVLNARGLGRVYNVRVENGSLKGDVFLDTTRAKHVPELAVILEALNAGKPTELSTGFPVSVDPTPGVHNGQSYDLRITPAGPLDHLAVFADKLGACSVKDGCGLGVNCSCQHDAADAAPVAPSPAANEPGNQPPKEIATMREQLIAQLTAAGEDAEALNKLSDGALKALAQPAQNGDESEVWKRLQEIRAENESLKATFAPVMESQDRERVRLLEDVLAVQSRPWSDQECMGMDYEGLKKVHAALCLRPDFSGRGAPGRGFSQNLLNHEVKSFFGTGNAVFARKEN